MEECNGTFDCSTSLMPINDALDVLKGKWTLPIIFSMTYGNKRFTDIQRSLDGISPKMLTQELKELERNQVITRAVDEDESKIEYSLSEYGETLEKILEQLFVWGQEHRKRIMAEVSLE